MHRTIIRIGGSPELEAELFLPEGVSAEARVPAVVTASGFGGVKEMLLPHFGEALARSGIAVLSVDYAGFGGSEGHPRQDLVPQQQISAMRRGLDWLSMDSRIDAQRLGVFGPSLCGGHTLAIAGQDSRVRAAVTMVPFVSAPKAPPSMALGRLIAIDVVKRAFGLPSVYVPIAGLPGSLGVMTTDHALDWITSVSGQAPNFRNEITVRSLARLATYRPVPMMGGRTNGPLLAILCKSDSITPAAAARRSLRGIPHEAVEFEGSHFELFEEHLPKVTKLTTAWFSTHLGVDSALK